MKLTIDCFGWACTARRNFGFVHQYRRLIAIASKTRIKPGDRIAIDVGLSKTVARRRPVSVEMAPNKWGVDVAVTFRGHKPIVLGCAEGVLSAIGQKKLPAKLWVGLKVVKA